MKQELICIDSAPALIEVNFEEVKSHLTTELKKYDVVVTVDTLKDAKLLATELNATKKHIDTRRKEEVAKASAPVRAFDDKMKELAAMCEQGRQRILSQVERFNEETRQKALELLATQREEMWSFHGIHEEFRRAEFDDLAIVSAVTVSGNLAASARNKLESRVREDKTRQDQTERRLLVLENQSYKAGLAAPLTRDHVSTFLFESDEVYDKELTRVLNAEIERQKVSEKAIRQRIESDRAQPETQKTFDPGEQGQPVQPEKPEDKKQAVETATKTPNRSPNFLITCEFHVDVDPRMPASAIKKKFIEKMHAAGFTTLESVTVSSLSNAGEKLVANF